MGWLCRELEYASEFVILSVDGCVVLCLGVLLCDVFLKCEFVGVKYVIEYV